MTWEELENLPEEIAGQIELWNGRVVWVRRGPAEHQEFTNLMWSGLRRCARDEMARQPEQCWRVHTETNVFLAQSGKNDFVTPDFLIHRCLPQPYQDVRADDVLLVGEVLSPTNTQTDIDDKKARYAAVGIPWYWEVTLERTRSAIAMVRAYALETDHGKLPPGVHPLYPANYLLTGKWTPKDSDGIVAALPFPIRIPWSELEF
ncbi:Uma2 family endonuclease [Nocardia sp. CDC159]|uniref:Uma2 family endonuclease n=1 Tax=Nocardia pulmonis TaxID=2951408 RepID=A0A9X2EAV4_9NOCA|nr:MULTISPECIES: Uma2 family endonuclease [Nocardia]MCM6776055.1 Uma2 family endonuclease [Nocardia pulmonis]MCM6788618.1 Uma2 family endonuclease [Nocardia sp. CDC159]